MKRRIFIVDDHAVMRWGYACLINEEPDLEVCGEAGTALEALEHIPENQPDLVIADISLEGMNGIELTKHLVAQHPKLPVLIVSMHDEAIYGERALRAGARGYIMKCEERDKIIEGIRRVLNGNFYLSDTMSTRILMQYQGHSFDEEASAIDRLSDRELEVFELYGRGFSTREIADKLLISPKTVESHRNGAKEKLGAETSSELMRHAVHWVTTEVPL